MAEYVNVYRDPSVRLFREPAPGAGNWDDWWRYLERRFPTNDDTPPAVAAPTKADTTDRLAKLREKMRMATNMVSPVAQEVPHRKIFIFHTRPRRQAMARRYTRRRR